MNSRKVGSFGSYPARDLTMPMIYLWPARDLHARMLFLSIGVCSRLVTYLCLARCRFQSKQ
eukprot:1901541-Amphidinium_carterae.1